MKENYYAKSLNAQKLYQVYQTKYPRVKQYFEAEKGLLGEIDMEQTKGGVIICKDGFRATTHSPEDMDSIGKASGVKYEITEVDESSIFLIVTKE